MLTSSIYTILGFVVVAKGLLSDDNSKDNKQWGPWGEGSGRSPSCASSCVSSYWASSAPEPTAFCDSNKELASCLSSACSSDPPALETFASACSRLSSCSSAGTFTYSGGPGWHRGENGGVPSPTAVVTVTGCPWDDDLWGFSQGPNDGEGPWGDWGSGWKYTTSTETITVTQDSGSATPVAVVVAHAVSGDETRKTTLSEAAASQTGADSGSGAPCSEGLAGVKVVVVCLAAALLMGGLV
ncbi:hypothetical protein B0T11DRAFT_104764 [Plectosphaerella cucumerina]|uniref:Extracellular membrane protein CFEM domain-containing protein n=1 Tax=Plectosphaerella cucumerina TaxID=40658 RepID=A0A8K0TBE7_9PEZI|nr:hypothetical protein B0T11DRAFT_104764 [Plectosphaerella cucumerina]